MPPMLYRLLIMGGFVAIVSSSIMYFTPIIYNQIYTQGWNDAEKFYRRYKTPPKELLKKQPPIEEGIWL